MTPKTNNEWEKELKDKVEGIIHAYAVNHYNAKEGDWRERRIVRNLALDDLEELFAQQRKEILEEVVAKIDKVYKKEKGIHHWLDLRDKLLTPNKEK